MLSQLAGVGGDGDAGRKGDAGRGGRGEGAERMCSPSGGASVGVDSACSWLSGEVSVGGVGSSALWTISVGKAGSDCDSVGAGWT